MLTPTHGFLASLFSRSVKKKWPRRTHFLFLAGAIIPDLPVLVVGFIEWIKYLLHHGQALERYWIAKSVKDLLYNNEQPPVVIALFQSVGCYRTALWLRECLHSLVFWALVLAAGYIFLSLRDKLVPLACGAIFFHIAIDWPTHTAYAHNYLWPLYAKPIPGLMSHSNPLLLKLEAAIFLAWALDTILRLARKTPSTPKT